MRSLSSNLACKLARLVKALLFVVTVGLLVPALRAGQDYVGRYDVYGGFGYLNSPHINLSERGFHTQLGLRLRRWLSVGFDYSVVTGHTTLTPDLLTTSLQQQLAATFRQLVVAGVIPGTYMLRVPIDSTTQNFAAGPQFAYRHWEWATLFIRPSVGAVREEATPHALDPIAAIVIRQLAPSGHKLDWTAFYGFGGGADLNLTRKFAIRLQADFVHDHLFNDLLKDGRNTVRVSIGPGFQFGPNVQAVH